ncbi:hypothetical protein ABW19_dt0209159 [Dactylella cylindrospora]|nr:hypothetical protein ABW19_dt0209159 [Dactylella cylindrospora]
MATFVDSSKRRMSHHEETEIAGDATPHHAASLISEKSLGLSRDIEESGAGSTILIEKPWTQLPDQTLEDGEDLKSLYNELYTRPHSQGWHKLFSDFEKLFDEPQFADVELFVGHAKRSVSAHRAILAQQSKIFWSHFSENSNQYPLKVDMSSFNFTTFYSILIYIYCRKVVIPKHPTLIAELYHESLFLGVTPMVHEVVEYIRSAMLTGGLEKRISVPYVIALVRGLASPKEVVEAGDVDKILAAIAEHPDFDEWLKVPSFIQMLEDTPAAASTMLRHLLKYKETKLEQDIAQTEGRGGIPSEEQAQALKALENLRRDAEGEKFEVHTILDMLSKISTH